MVSPLCSDWNFDRPYRWPYDTSAEPYPRNVFEWQLTEQIALAGLFDWEPRFMIGLPFEPVDSGVRCRTVVEPGNAGTGNAGTVEDETVHDDVVRLRVAQAQRPAGAAPRRVAHPRALLRTLQDRPPRR